MIDASKAARETEGSNTPARVVLEVRARRASLTLSAPPLNVFDFDLLAETKARLKTLGREKASIVVLRSGIKKAFSAGVDVRIHTPELAPRMLKAFHEIIKTITKMDAVFIAVVEGLCLGGGFELALACDFVIASPSSFFGFPEIDVGCFPPVAAALLPRLAPAAASDLVLTGRRVGASAALRLGLIHQVSANPEEAADELASRLLAKSSLALTRARRALRMGRRGSLSSAIERIERLYERDIAPSKDAMEGVRAFLEKRPPLWRHE